MLTPKDEGIDNWFFFNRYFLDISYEQKEIFQPWANKCFILTSSMHITEHANDTLNKRVGWASEATFSPEYRCRNPTLG
jgi:hypothetical protein